MISVNIQWSSGTAAQAAQAGEGLVPAQVWNNIVGQHQAEVKGVVLTSEAGNTNAVLSYISTDGVQQNVGPGILRSGVSAAGMNYNGLRSHAAVAGIPFDFYDLIIYSTAAKAGYLTPTLNGLNFNGSGEVVPFVKAHSAPQNMTTYVEGQNVVYVRHAMTADAMKFKAQWGLAMANAWDRAQGGFAAFQIVEVPSVTVPVAADTAWEALALDESEARQVSVVNVANGATLSVSDAQIAAMDAFVLNSYFLDFNENGKLAVTLSEGETSVRIRTQNLKPENLTVSLSDNTTPTAVYLSYLDEYVQISTESLTFGEATWLTEDVTRVKWMWKEAGDTSWQTVESLEDLAKMQMTARFEGWFSVYAEPPVVTISDMVVVGDVVRVQAKHIENNDFIDGNNVSLGSMKTAKFELSLEAGVVSIRGIEIRSLNTQDYATDLWSAGLAPKPAFLAQSSETGICGIYDLRACPKTVARDASGANHQTLSRAFDVLAARRLASLTITENVLVESSETFLNNITYSVAEGKQLTIGSGATLTLNRSRMGGRIAFADSTSKLAMQMDSPAEVITIETPSTLSLDNLVLTDGFGENITQQYQLSVVEGGYTLRQAVSEIEITGTVTLDDTIPTGGNVKIRFTGDTVVTLAYPRTYDTVLLEGEGTIRFVGTGLNASAYALSEGVEWVLDGTSSPVNEPTLISGFGGLRTKGTVTLGGANTFSGGIVVESGTLNLSESGRLGTGVVTVWDGACVDVAHVGDACMNTFVVAGRGVNESGVLFCSGAADSGVTNWIAGLELSSNAFVRANASWGVKPPQGVSYSPFALNGYTLTKAGVADCGFEEVIRPVGDTAGKILVTEGSLTWGTSSVDNPMEVVFEKGTLLRYHNQAPNTKATFTLNEGTTFDVAYQVLMSKAPIFEFHPTAEDPITFTGAGSFIRDVNNGRLRVWEDRMNPQSDILKTGESTNVINSYMTKQNFLQIGSMAWSLNFGTRYTVTLLANAVPVTAKELAPVYHYDFEGEGEDWYANTKGKAVALDSAYFIHNADAWPNNVVNPQQVQARMGHAVLVGNGTAKFSPQWSASTYSARKNFYSCHVSTIITIFKPIATDQRIVWSFGINQTAHPILALVVEDEQTLSLICKQPNATKWDVLASVSEIADLTTKEHFVALRANGYGLRFIVDDREVNVANTIPSFSEDQYATQGRSGRIGGLFNATDTYLGYRPMPDEGYYLNDWQVYDTALSDAEIDAIRRHFWGGTTLIIVR